MKRPALAPIFAALIFAAPAHAIDIFAAQGAWVGQGSLATTVERPLQSGRCQVDVAPQAGGDDVSVTGKCAVAVGGSNVSFRMVRGAGTRVSAALWAAATDETLQLSGNETAGGLDLVTSAPWVVEGVRYETRVTVREPDADSFAIRQMVRAEGDSAWRLLVDMTYRRP